MQLKKSAQKGFSLTELAVVMAIVGLLIVGGLSTLSGMTEQRTLEETNKRLNAAVDALIGYAMVNKRLPCPAVGNATGVEALSSGDCSTYFGGFLPGRTLGFAQVDSSGYALDAWGNRIRYAVASTITGCTGGSSALPHFVSMTNLKANGVSCKPADLDVLCSSAGPGVSATCNNTVHVADQNTIAFIVFSTGKNGSLASGLGNDETGNTDGNAVFYSRPVSDSSSTLGSFDDVMVMVPAGVLYSRLVSAGVLP